MFTKELFGVRLKETRLKAGETQADLAEILHINKSRISEIEKGVASTTPEKVAMICQHYQVSADYLLGLSDDPCLYKGEEEKGPLV